ncbi:MAG: apolipoprotein N-acyltransferase, partial [Alphaproteobacteria bacterium]|nr:apolipoprotein N-acyltransferase [Alphaproteobacteria bacterium]
QHPSPLSAGRLARFAAWLTQLQGKRVWLVSCGLGVLLTLAFAPFKLLPFSFLAFSGLFLLLEGRLTAKNAFAAGWWFGLGHHVTGLYWITIALGVDNGAFLWMVPFALLLLPAYLGLFTGLVGYLFHRLAKHTRTRADKVILLAVLWVLGEIARTEFLYGFPWNHLGYITSAYLPMMQGAAYVGVYGMSLWMALLSLAFALLLDWRGNKRFLAVVFSASVLLTLWGAGRITEESTESRPLVRVVQANIPQSLKWDPNLQHQALQKHADFSLKADVKPDYIVWPETAMPYPFTSGSNWAEALASIVPEDATLLTGVLRVDKTTRELKVWNSVQAVNHQAEVIAVYDKHILVPFGEFVPFRALLAPFGLNKITPGTSDFTRGEGAKVIDVGGAAPHVQPLICYETIFPAFRTSVEGNQPDWLLNATNDAWFGTSTGPYQHLEMARMRAVERATPLVRAANTGVSAVFDSYGNTLASLPLNQEGVLDVRLPQQKNAPTWYSRYGEFTLLIVIFFLFTFCFRGKWNKT